MAGMFLGVVLAFPDGLAGVYTQRVKPWLTKRFTRREKVAPPAALPIAPPPVAAQATPALPTGLSGQQT
jgi:urea transport system permease protein